MTQRLLTTSACVHAILAAVCAAHLTAESTQVSACRVPRRVVTEGSPGKLAQKAQSPNFSPSLRVQLSVSLPNVHPHTPSSWVAQRVAVRSSTTTLILARPPSLSLSLLSLPFSLPFSLPVLPAVLARRGEPDLPHLSVGNHPNARHRVSHGVRRSPYGRIDSGERMQSATTRRYRGQPRVPSAKVVTSQFLTLT